ncbi:WYL domain-containing protein [Gleimia europaea]|uniref:helix-turn-helix transcriptional regulator n=1 Tax=Gleimia europaea TaxID=66228 RepID=UPI0026586B9E|nr:WYL domain-containing protein [Gleimia europaea]MDK7143820.1 WYL domain-containing protein [Gleimia europaea]
MNVDTSRGQRLLGLVLALSKRELGLTATQIFDLVPGYEVQGPARERRFTRDKADLKDMGFNLKTGVNHSGDEIYILEKGAGIEADLTPAEELLVHAASGLWSKDREPNFYARLHAILTNPGSMPQTSLSGLRAVAAFARAVTEGKLVVFTYKKPYSDVLRRTVEPWYMFLQDGNLYMCGYDRGRQDKRTFRLSRVDENNIEILDEPIVTAPAEDDDRGLFLISPTLAIKEGAALLTRQHTRATGQPVPSGWEIHEGKAGSLGVWLERVLGEIDNIVVLGPPSLVRAVDRRIEALGE